METNEQVHAPAALPSEKNCGSHWRICQSRRRSRRYGEE